MCYVLCFNCCVFVVVKTSTYKIIMMHFSLAFLISLFRSVTFSILSGLYNSRFYNSNLVLNVDYNLH